MPPKAKKATESAASAPKTTRAKKPENTETSATKPQSGHDVVNIEERIRNRAYELFLERNGDGGSPEEDWIRAESEIRGKSA